MNSILNNWTTPNFPVVNNTWGNTFPVSGISPFGFNTCGNCPGAYSAYSQFLPSFNSQFVPGLFNNYPVNTFLNNGLSNVLGSGYIPQNINGNIPAVWFNTLNNSFVNPFNTSINTPFTSPFNTTPWYTPVSGNLNNTWGFNTPGYTPFTSPFNTLINTLPFYGVQPGFNTPGFNTPGFTPSFVPSFSNIAPITGVDAFSNNLFNGTIPQNFAPMSQWPAVNGVGYPQNFTNTYPGTPWFNTTGFGVPTNGFTNLNNYSYTQGIPAATPFATVSGYPSIPGYIPGINPAYTPGNYTPGNYTPSYNSSLYQGFTGFSRPVNGACPTTSTIGGQTAAVGYAGQTICRDAA